MKHILIDILISSILRDLPCPSVRGHHYMLSERMLNNILKKRLRLLWGRKEYNSYLDVPLYTTFLGSLLESEFYKKELILSDRLMHFGIFLQPPSSEQNYQDQNHDSSKKKQSSSKRRNLSANEKQSTKKASKSSAGMQRSQTEQENDSLVLYKREMGQFPLLNKNKEQLIAREVAFSSYICKIPFYSSNS